MFICYNVHTHLLLASRAGMQSGEAEEEAEASPFAPYSVYVQREMGVVNNMMKASYCFTQRND